MDPADLKVDVKKYSVMRPLHARSLTNIYNLFNITERGRRVISNGWKAAGITEAVADASGTQQLI